jgi:hypothetical protein
VFVECRIIIIISLILPLVRCKTIGVVVECQSQSPRALSPVGRLHHHVHMTAQLSSATNGHAFILGVQYSAGVLGSLNRGNSPSQRIMKSQCRRDQILLTHLGHASALSTHLWCTRLPRSVLTAKYVCLGILIYSLAQSVTAHKLAVYCTSTGRIRCAALSESTESNI